MKIGIFGSGAVGISIAAHIYDYDPNIIYLCARDRHYESLNNGVTYNGKHYDINRTQEMAMDYLIVCVKNYDLESSLDDMKYFISDKTIILPLLNGITAHDVIRNKYLKNRILYGMIRIEANINGKEVNSSEIGLISFGDKYNIDNNYLDELKNIFDKSNINSNIPEDMIRAVWLKWMLNIGINQVSALTKSTYKDMHHEYLQELLYNLFQEIVALAKLEGVYLSIDDCDYFIKESKTWDSNRYTSLACDFINKKPKNELEYFSGEALRRAKKHNLNLPYNEFMYKCLKAMSDNFNK